MGLFKRKKFNNINLNNTSVQLDDILLNALLNGEEITKEKALTLPVVASAVDFIASSIASMPVKLYKIQKGKIVEDSKDIRVRLLNNDTGDTINAYDLKKAMVSDYLLEKGGYTVIKKFRNKTTALKYVEPIYVSCYKNVDPVDKYVNFMIDDKVYKEFEILRLLRNTKDGATGTSVVKEIAKCLETAYSTLLYQLGLVKTGGNKKGFLQTDSKLSQEDIDALKTAWKKMYQNNTESVVVLNNGLKFQESSNTSTEMQLNESKKTLNADINNVFHITDNFEETFKKAIYPIMKAFEATLNRTLLLESEKTYMFFEFEVKEILRANIKDRYEAYGKALKDGWKTVNEIRKEDNLNEIEGMDILSLNLGDVLYDTKSKTFYTPNTKETFKQDEVVEEGSENENEEV